MVKIRNLKGKRFGKLFAVRNLEQRGASGSVLWECRCDCGNTVVVQSGSLISGNTRSCGCLKSQTASRTMRRRVKAESVDGTRLSYITGTRFSHNTSGVRGVSYQQSSGMWKAEITFKGKRYYLGIYKTRDLAVKARKMAEEKLWNRLLQEHIGNFRDEAECKRKIRKYINDRLG